MSASNRRRRVGSQSFRLMDTLWIDGGRIVDENAAVVDEEPQTLSANLSVDFISPPGPIMAASSRPPYVPLVSNGFMWSNLVDRAWLFGGKSLHDPTLKNDIWRFERGDNGPEWTPLIVNSSIINDRPTNGAGCNVPDLQRGYYLGGLTQAGSEIVWPYLHQLTIFDMQNETLSTISVPDFVPIINQSLVYVNTATRSGALVAIGGYTEINGALTLANTSLIHVFDIESQQWMSQSVTASNGSRIEPAKQADGFPDTYPDTFPSRRILACAAVGSAPDKTSHNIVLLGGQNSDTAIADGWVLSLPGGIWTRAQNDPNFLPNFPTTESSCLLLNSKFLFMDGGCLLYVHNHTACMNFSTGPFTYDISQLDTVGYENTKMGYLVPDQVSDIIGGNGSGLVHNPQPKYTNFSHPLIKELFTPPRGILLDGPFFYESRVLVLVICLLAAPYLCLIPLTIRSLIPLLTRAMQSFKGWIRRIGGRLAPFSNKFRSLRGLLRSYFPNRLKLDWAISFIGKFKEWWVLISEKVVSCLIYLASRVQSFAQFCFVPIRFLRDQSQPIYANRLTAWNGSWAFTDGYLFLIHFTTFCLVGLTDFLRRRSSLPDPLFEHWSGGLTSSGTWTGIPFESTFIRAPTYERPPQGILSHYYDSGAEGVFNQKNTTTRLGRGVYWTFTFLPMLVAVLYGRMWKSLDDEVKRLDPYHRLQTSRATTASQTILLNYHTFWAPLSIFQAFVYGHWSVMFSSLGMVLATIVIPILANYVFFWDVYSGAVTSWSDSYSWQVALVNSHWANTLIGALSVTGVCGIIVHCLLRYQTTLRYEVRGIAGLASLIEGMNGDYLQFPESFRGRLYEARQSCFSNVRLSLGSTPNGLVLHHTQSNGDDIFFVCRWLTKMMGHIPCHNSVARLKNLIFTQGKFFPFRLLVFLFWLAALLAFMVVLGWITASLNKNSKTELWNLPIPISPDVYLVAGIFIQSIVDVIDNEIRSLAPFYALSKGCQPPRVLWADYTASIPFWDILVAWNNEHYLACSSMLASLATAIFTIFLGSLQLSSSAYGSTTFESDLAAATACTLLISYILAVNLFIGYYFVWKNPACLEVQPDNIAMKITYTYHSQNLREDLRNASGIPEVRRRIESLENNRYGIGQFTDANGVEQEGIERDFCRETNFRPLTN